ncbi:sensor histidine kinase [Winogradskya humida]|uniref:histidine kinase n=1 Tax=Winogradskya humida TaxID=113566 RepID=A0ABQ4A0X9_9ACTN|nr:histidine kinase [Actinoplanes humidus]GIE24516.1 two-component sensor histidine kinase [Actinoplanes humidus]
MRLRNWHPQVTDAVAGGFLFVFALISVAAPTGADRGGGPPAGLDFLVCGVAWVLVALRRRWPLPVLAVSAAFTILAISTPLLLPPATLAVLVCAYTVATRTARMVAWPSALAAAVAVYLAAGIAYGTWAQPEAVAIFASAGMAVAVGDLVRTRRAYLAEVLDRARRAERSREEEARRRVIEERVRIARELHDVVAHHIAMINVQAGVAAHVLRDQPDEAGESLAHVRHAARTVLAELSTVLGVLRGPGHPGDPVDEPARGLAHLSELIARIAGAGLRVEERRNGQARPLPSAVDLAAYRIIQESLTNAHKHALDDRARLRLRFAEDELEITVENFTANATAGATGYGLVGMRERATALGGRFSAEATGDGRFVVHAVLPAPRAAA